MVRTYDMSKRAAAASETANRITEATEKLLISGPVGDVTLQSHRRWRRGHRPDGAAAHGIARRVFRGRRCPPAGPGRSAAGSHATRDVDAAISGLLDHYETDGRLVLNLLLRKGWTHRWHVRQRSRAAPTTVRGWNAASVHFFPTGAGDGRCLGRRHRHLRLETAPAGPRSVAERHPNRHHPNRPSSARRLTGGNHVHRPDLHLTPGNTCTR